jgi:ABC-2 type transport system ATP-binding protein
MENCILRTSNLTKSYHGVNALHDVSIALKAGKIYGLIGQNGAGKSTLMRLITGLCFPTDGSMELFGHTGESALRAERKRLGSMIEYPSLVPDMTAKENLRVHRIMKGIPDKNIEDDLLKLVGLVGTNKKKAKNFSLGMKQRLGIAIALLGNPELLILDEPINGLDPIGVVDIRNLLKKLCDEQHMSILISSHNLPELFQTATDYIMIQQGEIKQILTLEELEERCRHHILIGSLEPEKMISVLEMKLGARNYKVMPDKTVKLYDFLDERERVAQTLFDNGIVVTNLSNDGDTLEDYYVSVMGGGKNA